MKNKKMLFVLVLGVILSFLSKNNLIEYYYCKKAEKEIVKERYSQAIENYQKALKFTNNKNSGKILSNIIKTYYMEKKYDEIVKLDGDENFIKGNSYVYLSNEKENKYKEALESYKKDMLEKDDINIKKNYEIIYNLSNQQNQDSKQKQENQNSDKNSENQENKNQNQNNSQENKENSNNSDENEKNQEDNNKQDKQNNSANQENKNEDGKQDNKDNGQDKQDNKNSGNSNEKNDAENKKDKDTKSNEKNENDSKNGENSKDFETGKNIENSESSIKEAELKAILQRMEAEEKQAFKNNERVMYKSNSDKNNKNSW